MLGLEIFKRFQKKTLAISPTMIVRDQWVERLADFLPAESSADEWCSHSLTQPSLFTTTTYQGLYSFEKRFSKAKAEASCVSQQYESLQAWFKHHDIQLLILDEAHHLKAAWWDVLMKLISDSDDLIIVSLTATPPYDASSAEWSRYMELCGPVDEEISIPELVRSKSLCPHQDYIWMVKTDERNVSSLNRQQTQLKQFIQQLTEHHELLYLLQLHHWLDPQHPPNTRDLLYHLDECLALLALLKQQGQSLPDYLLTSLGKTSEEIETMDVFDWEVLLQSFIDGQHYPAVEPVNAFRETLSSLLRGKHFLRQRRVSLDNTARKLQAFNKTQERIKGCFDIVTVEHATRQEWMRLVVLADYIRDEKYQLSLDGLEAPTGCYPIFHYFIHHLEPSLAAKTALLTGRLSVVHRSLLSKLAKVLPQGQEVSSIDYSEHLNFVVLTMPSQVLSAAFTALHKSGDLHVLIGTRALLGEGWDAPHVNSLILATQTGAYVTTNQLRGRAIRLDPEDTLKTASIWHIIAVAPDMTNNKLIFNDLNRRFKTFAGIHANELQIESGIERLVFADGDFDETSSFAQRSNQLMINRLEDDVFNLQARWQNALEKVEKHVFQLGLQMELSSSRQWQHLTYAFSNKQSGFLSTLTSPLGMSASTFGLLAPIGLAISAGAGHVATALAGLGGAGLALLLTKIGKDVAWNRYFSKTPQTSTRYSNIQAPSAGAEELATMQSFAQIVLDALRDTGQISTTHTENNAANEITVTELKAGYFRFSLNDFTRQENDTFLTGLSQLLEPIRQPRYILTLAKQPKANQIIPVPHILGNNKKNAVAFATRWNHHFPTAKTQAMLHWTATPEGQRYLLKARVAAHDDKEDAEISLIDRWE